jgi:iron complex outermembrane receptor protein
MKKTPIASAVSLALAHGTLMVGGYAAAQDNVDAAESTEEVQEIEEIITTGSRIRKDVFTSSTPLEVIDIEEASVQGIANVGELLQNSTTASGSPQITSAISAVTGVENGGVGTNTISLRGLGANRTLLLLNGRRAGPSGTRGGVSSFDLSVLPLATIERIEVLKDGASSIYGSDAVAGVVNIITRREEGGTFDGFVSMPNESGGEETRLSASWGRNFNRGGFRVTADYNKQEELAQGDRDYFSCEEDYVFSPDSGERADRVDPRTGEYKCSDTTWGHVWVYDYGGTNTQSFRTLAQYDYDGDLGQYIPGYGPVTNAGDLQTPPGWFPTGYDLASSEVQNTDHPFQDETSLIPEIELTTIYAEGDYQLSDNVELYGEFLLNRRENYVNAYRQFWSYMDSGDFRITSEIAANAGWFGGQNLSPTAITDHFDSSITVDYQRFLTGLRGEFSNGWTWDVTGAYSLSEGSYSQDVIFSDAIGNGGGEDGQAGFVDQIFFYQTSCEGQLTTVRGIPCVDVDWFSEDLLNGNPSAQDRAFLFGNETGKTEYTQWSIDAFVTGELFDLPAGALSIAAGIHYRDDEIEDVPGEVTRANNSWGLTAAGITAGDDKTEAVFLEIDAPLLEDVPAIQNLTLNASARYTDVDSYGSDTTWKVGINWQVLDSLRIRANRGTSFRTPALFELYLADQTSFIGQRSIDPCIGWGQALADGDITQTLADNCAADGVAPDFTGGSVTATVITGGGLGVLEAETSESETYGIIWQPGFADLSVSIDYFDIEISDEVAQFGAARIVAGCYGSEDGFAFGNDEALCRLFERTGLAGGIDNIRDSYINIASQTSRGIDYAVRYTSDLGGWGDFRVDLRANKQLEDTIAVFTDDPDDLNKLVGDPEWVGQYSFALARDQWEVFYNGRYVGAASNARLLSDDVTTLFGETVKQVLDVDSLIYHSLSAAYTFDDSNLRVLVGVSNLTDEEPPRVSSLGDNIRNVGNAVFESQYDWVGRRVFMNVTWDFD